MENILMETSLKANILNSKNQNWAFNIYKVDLLKSTIFFSCLWLTSEKYNLIFGKIFETDVLLPDY